MEQSVVDLPLRDIHLPDSVSWWPLAPGWYLLLCLIVLISLSLFLFIRWKEAKKQHPYTLANKTFIELQQLYSNNNDSAYFIRELSKFFRQLAVHIKPRAEVAALTGDVWLEFLDEEMEGQPFSQGIGRVLAEAPYKEKVEVEQAELLSLCQRWIDKRLKDIEVKPKKIRFGKVRHEKGQLKT